MVSRARERFSAIRERERRRDFEKHILEPLLTAHRKQGVPDLFADFLDPFLVPVSPPRLLLSAPSPRGFDGFPDVPASVVEMLSRLIPDDSGTIPGTKPNPYFRGLFPPEMLSRCRLDVDRTAQRCLDHVCCAMRTAGCTEETVSGWRIDMEGNLPSSLPPCAPRSPELEAVAALAAYLGALKTMIPRAVEKNLPVRSRGRRDSDLDILDVPSLESAFRSPNEDKIRQAAEKYFEEWMRAAERHDAETRMSTMGAEELILEALPDSQKVSLGYEPLFLYLRTACRWEPARGSDGKSEIVDLRGAALSQLRELAQELERGITRQEALGEAIRRFVPEEPYRIPEAIAAVTTTKKGRMAIGKVRALVEKAQRETLRVLVRVEYD
jgi:hypothetical protein